MVIASLWWLGSRNQTRPTSPRQQLAAESFVLSPRLRQSDEQFGYEVVSRALDRSADANRFLDTLFFALMAAQAALFAIIVDRLNEYAFPAWSLLLAGFVSAAIGTALSLFVRDGPDPESFAADFPADPTGTRQRYVNKYVDYARRNDRLHVTKVVVLVVSLVLTIGPLVVATVGRAHGV